MLKIELRACFGFPAVYQFGCVHGAQTNQNVRDCLNSKRQVQSCHRGKSSFPYAQSLGEKDKGV